ILAQEQSLRLTMQEVNTSYLFHRSWRNTCNKVIKEVVEDTRSRKVFASGSASGVV
ncbi:hypothetical protein HK102_008646, partial [Quaeritorhiza haematococci]